MDTKIVPNNKVGFQQNVKNKAVDRNLLDEMAKQQQDSKAKKSDDQMAQAVGVDLSPSAKSLAEAHAKAFEIAMGTPEVNEDRVAELKKKIQDGTYKINAGGIADGILREAVLDRLAEQE